MITNIRTVLLVAVMCGACTQQPFTHSYTPALLLQRSAGLYIDEFEMQQQRYQEAVSALGQDNPNVQALAQLATIFVYEERVTGNHEYYNHAALDAIECGLKQQPQNHELLALKANVFLSEHRFEEARAIVNELISRSATTAMYWGMLCDAELELGNVQAAVKAVNRMMSLRPGMDAYARVSYLRERTGDVKGAIDAMKLAVQAGVPGTHDAAWTRTTYGNVLLKSGDTTEAKCQYQLACLERLNFPEAHAALENLQHGRSAHHHDHEGHCQ